MTRKEPKVGEVWSFNYERYLQLKDHKEYTYYKYKGYRVLDIKITYLATNIIEAHDIYGKLFYLTENELLYFFDYDLNRFDFDYIEIISLETSYEFFVFFIKEDKVICADYLAKNKILFNYIFDEIRTNNKIIREIIE